MSVVDLGQNRSAPFTAFEPPIRSCTLPRKARHVYRDRPCENVANPTKLEYGAKYS